MHYTVYKITHKPTGKVYIGKHQTKDLEDNYMGSGKHLKRAIEKYGIDQFEKEILHVFTNEADMNAKEAELVTEGFCKRDDTYNLCPGGHGGFGYINSFQERPKTHNPVVFAKISKTLKGRTPSLSNRRAVSNAHKEGKINYNTFLGKKHSEETKRKIKEANSKHQSGKNNSQYGTMWITNGSENRKIKKEVDTIPEGWYKGRKY